MNARVPDMMQVMEALIATPSISSARPELDQGNREVIDLLAGWFTDLGFSVNVSPIPEQPQKANMLATLGQGSGGLVLAGHTDTVPYDDGRWTHDPFRLTERDGRLYGLGTADMKGFFALIMEAVRGLSADDLDHPLTVIATANEETDMAGAKALAEDQFSGARYAVIGEPTGMRPVHLHKGIMMEAVHLTGHSGHSSDPAQGVSALDGMYRVIGELMAWRKELAGSHRDDRFLVPIPTLNLGHVHGGDNPNRICAECTLHLDLRPLPGMDLENLRHDLRERVRKALAHSELRVHFETLFDGVPPLETAPDSRLVREMEQLTGQAAGAVTFGTEGPYLTRLGMETVILGPGDLAQAHQPDEYIERDRVGPTVEILQQLIARFCAPGSEA